MNIPGIQLSVVASQWKMAIWIRTFLSLDADLDFNHLAAVVLNIDLEKNLSNACALVPLLDIEAFKFVFILSVVVENGLLIDVDIVIAIREFSRFT